MIYLTGKEDGHTFYLNPDHILSFADLPDESGARIMINVANEETSPTITVEEDAQEIKRLIRSF